MKREKELVFNTIIIAIGGFVSKVLSFFLLPIYTSYLSTTDYGNYDLILTISMFIVSIITMLMEESMFRFLIDCKTDKERKKILSGTLYFILKNLIFFSVIYLIIILIFEMDYKLLFGLYVISMVLSYYSNAMLRGFGKIKSYSLINCISSLITVLLNILFVVVFNFGIASLLISTILVRFISVICIFIIVKIHKYINFKNIDKDHLKEMLHYSVPLIQDSVSWNVINMSDRLIITAIIGSAANGIYSIAYKWPNLMDTIYGYFYTSWKESAAKTLKDADSDNFYNLVYKNLKNIMWSVVLLLITFLPFIYGVLIQKDFYASYLYVPILLIAMFYINISSFYGGIFSAHKNTKTMGTTTLIGAIINIVVDFALIKFIGLFAAAISTLVSALFIYLYRKIEINKYVVLKENAKLIILDYVVLCISLIEYYYFNTLGKIITFVIVVIYCIIKNRSIINVVFDKVKYLKKRF